MCQSRGVMSVILSGVKGHRSNNRVSVERVRQRYSVSSKGYRSNNVCQSRGLGSVTLSGVKGHRSNNRVSV